MTKRNQNFSFYQGESKIIFFDLSNPSGTEFDPTGTTMRWWLAKTPYSLETESGSVLIEKSLGSGLTVVTGGVNLQLYPDDTADIPSNYYYHELKLFLPAGGNSVAAEGVVHVRPSLKMRDRLGVGVGRATVAGTGTVT